MNFEINTNQVILKEQDQVESGEYNVTECNFTFSSEYEDLTKKAVFTGEDGTAYLQTIVNNKCSIPSEILQISQVVQIGVYAYELENEELKLRYSPKPTQFFIHQGSYKEAQNSTPPTPSEIEQLQSQITTNANDISNIKTEQITQNTNIQTNADNITNLQNTKADKSEIPTKTSDLINDSDFVVDNNYVHTDNNFTNEDKSQIQTNKDDIVEINQTIDAINTDITNINSAVSDINDDIEDLEQSLTSYSLITETGSQIELNINSSDFKLKAILKDKNGNTIYTSNIIDLPLETMVVGASYDNVTKEVVLTLQNGTTVRFSVADLVSGLVSTDQLTQVLSNYYNKNEVEALIPDLTNYVKNTDYGTANKGGTIKSGNNLMIPADTGIPYVSSRTYEQYQSSGNNMFVSKGTLENVIAGKQLINQTQLEESQATQDTQIEALQAENTELKQDIANMSKAMLTTKGQGTDFTLNNTTDNKFVEFEGSGNTEQEQLEGYNLYSSELELGTINTSTGANGVSSNCVRSVDYIEVEENTTYMISNNNNYQEIVYFYDQNKAFISVKSGTNGNYSFTTPVGTKYIRNRTSEGSTQNDLTTKFQLVLGNTEKSFEPYCGGIPAPNPSYEIPVKNVTGDVVNKIQNKNLLDKDNASILDAYINSTNATIVANTKAKTLYIPCKPNTTYTISKILSARFIIISTIEKPIIGSIGTVKEFNNTATSLSITTGVNDKYISVFYYLETADTLTEQQILDSIQIKYGSTATSYVEHKEQNLPLTLGDIELCKIDTAKDYFFKNVVGSKYYNAELLENKWYLHKEIGKKVLDGSESGWSRNQTTNYYRYYLTLDLGIKTPTSSSTTLKAQILSSKFVGETMAGTWSGRTGISTSYPDTTYPYVRLCVCYVSDETNTLSKFKEWLANNNVPVYYPLKTPTNTLVTDTTLEAQLENLYYKSMSYDEQTNISSTSNELGMIIDAEAIQNINNVINNLIQS